MTPQTKPNMLKIQKAERNKIKLRLALAGPSGSGKTWDALAIASELAGPNGKILCIDTERGSARRYADRYQFDVIEVDDFRPETFIEGIALAKQHGYDVLVIDSLSHAWSGVLERLDEVAARTRSGSSYHAWRDVTPVHNKLITSIISSPCHVIATLRVKQKIVETKDEKGRTKLEKVGLETIQRDGVEYEFDLTADIDLITHRLVVSKSRFAEVADRTYEKHEVGEFAQALNAAANAGTAPAAPAPTPQPATPAEPTTLDAETVAKLVEVIGDHGAKAYEFLQNKGWLSVGDSLETLNPKHAERILANPQGFLKAIGA